MRKAMSKKVGAGGRFDIFLDSVIVVCSPWHRPRVFCLVFNSLVNCNHGCNCLISIEKLLCQFMVY